MGPEYHTKRRHMLIRCLGEEVGEESPFRLDVDGLNKFDDAMFYAFLRLVVTFLTHPDDHNLLGEVEELAEIKGVKLGLARNVSRTLFMITKGAVTHQLTSEQFRSDLINLGFDSPKIDQFVAIFGEATPGVSAAIVENTMTVNELVDMQWKFGVTASNAELKQVGSTFLQMKLGIDKGGGDLTNVFAELSLPQFYKFLSEMERANAALDDLAR
eukprot:c4580_g1_i1.p1 GENE.c4580_g1_i1~~c4580_g1_i1.p1  ORF type:complete len:214 (+),score=49.81 c4580_g1_i1:1-642(+)